MQDGTKAHFCFFSLFLLFFHSLERHIVHWTRLNTIYADVVNYLNCQKTSVTRNWNGNQFEPQQLIKTNHSSLFGSKKTIALRITPVHRVSLCLVLLTLKWIEEKKIHEYFFYPNHKYRNKERKRKKLSLNQESALQSLKRLTIARVRNTELTQAAASHEWVENEVIKWLWLNRTN